MQTELSVCECVAPKNHLDSSPTKCSIICSLFMFFSHLFPLHLDGSARVPWWSELDIWKLGRGVEDHQHPLPNTSSIHPAGLWSPLECLWPLYCQAKAECCLIVGAIWFLISWRRHRQDGRYANSYCSHPRRVVWMYWVTYTHVPSLSSYVNSCFHLVVKTNIPKTTVKI